MIHHRTANRGIIVLVIIAVLFCIGGLMTGMISKDYDLLREDLKIESEVVDVLQSQGEAEVIIILKDDEKRNIKGIQSDVLSSNPDFKVKYKYNNINAISGKLDKKILNEIKEHPDVEKIYFNKIYLINLDDTTGIINANKVWNSKLNDIYLTGLHESVCVIDTGVNYNHPNLNILGGYDFVNNDSDPIDDHSHGSHIAGIISSNDTTYKGIAYESGIIAIKACDSSGNCNGDNVLAGIDWCISNASIFNISVISMSIGDNGEYNETTCPTDFDNAINSAVNNNISVVIASGNTYHNNGISSPSCSPNATSVGATTKTNNIWARTNTGELLDLLAPGVDVTSTILGSNFGSKDGTSIATPHVSAAIAIINQHARLEIGDLATPYPKTNANIIIYGNYSNRTDNASITNATCKINFTDSPNNLMDWNASLRAYQYIRNFSSPDFYVYNITCNHSDFETLVENSNIEVVQGSENCTYPGSNIDWNLTGNEYSSCVGENLIINQSNINIEGNAKFILRDTTITLIGASTHYTINISDDANFSLYNSNIKGMDETTRRLDIDLYGEGDIINSTFENSSFSVGGTKSHIINDSLFRYHYTSKENASVNIINSTFEDYVYFRINSINTIENSSFRERFYTFDSAYINIKNSTLSGRAYFEENSIINFSELSNLTNDIRTYDSPIIYGEADMPDTGLVATGNLTRYYPVYVYYNDGSTVYPNREVRIIDNNSDLIWQGTTNSQGYVESNLILNTTNYGTGNFNITTNEVADIYLLTDTPINLKVEEDPPDGGNGGGPGGGSSDSCEENWSCSDWSECIDGTQNRTCVDLEDCGTTNKKPIEMQMCNSNTSSTNKNKGGRSRQITIEEEIPKEEITGVGDCCLLWICGGRLLGICWYWWIISTLIIGIFIIIFNQREREKRKTKKKKIFKNLLKPLGIGKTLKSINAIDL